MKGAGFIIVSLIFHSAMIAAIAFDDPARPVVSGHPVKIRIVSAEPQPEKEPAPKPRPQAKPVPKRTVSPVVKKTEPKKPEPVVEPSPQVEEAPPEEAPSDPAAASAPQHAEEAPSDNAGSDHAEAAQLIVRSFVKPRYTLPARKARYETEFVAEVLVTRSGRAKEVKFDKDIMYEMDERIIQSIKRASFKPAKNRLGMAVDSWVRIPFRLEMSE